MTQRFGTAVDLRHQAPSVALVLLVVFLVRDLPPVHDPADELRAERGPGLRDVPRSSCRRRRASRARRRSRTRRTRSSRDIPGVADAHGGHRLQPARQRLQDQRRHDLRHVQRLRRSATRTIDTAKKENARAILQGFFAKARLIESAIVIPIAPPRDSRHRHDRRLRVLDPGHRHRRSRRARRRDAGLPREGARAARAHRPRARRIRRARSSCAPTSTATRRSCSAFRSRTSTARSRRSSARSRSASTTSSPTSGG